MKEKNILRIIIFMCIYVCRNYDDGKSRSHIFLNN